MSCAVDLDRFLVAVGELQDKAKEQLTNAEQDKEQDEKKVIWPRIAGLGIVISTHSFDDQLSDPASLTSHPALSGTTARQQSSWRRCSSGSLEAA